MFLLYCNKCFRLRSLHLSMQLHLSACGHVLCSQCVQAKCAICSRPYRAQTIDSNMPASMAVYFEESTKIYRRYQKVLKFQTEQQARYNQHFIENTPGEMEKTLREYQGFLKLKDRFDAQIVRDKQRIAKMKEYLNYHERRSKKPESLNASLSRSQRSHGQSRPQTPTLSLHETSEVSGESKSEDLFPQRNDFTM